MQFLATTFFKNSVGLFVLIVVWLIFAAIGLRGVTLGKDITEIRQETGFSLLSFFVLVIALMGLIAFIYTNPSTSPVSPT